MTKLSEPNAGGSDTERLSEPIADDDVEIAASSSSSSDEELPQPVITGFKLNMAGVRPNQVDDAKPMAFPPTPKESVVQKLRDQEAAATIAAVAAAAATFAAAPGPASQHLTNLVAMPAAAAALSPGLPLGELNTRATGGGGGTANGGSLSTTVGPATSNGGELSTEQKQIATLKAMLDASAKAEAARDEVSDSSLSGSHDRYDVAFWNPHSTCLRGTSL